MLATNASRPRPRLFRLAHRIARRFEPSVAAAFLDAIAKLQRQIDEASLRSAIASGRIRLIESAIASGGDLQTILESSDLQETLRRTAIASGFANADVLAEVLGLDVEFNAFHPNVILYAREQVALLVVAVGEDVKEAIRIVVALAQEQGLTTVQQARALREIVGLPPNWSSAPLNLAKELREGRFTESRRLSAADKATIRARIKAGTVDEAFIERMQSKYTASLLNRRGLNIARTETLRASHFGQREEWRQAMRQGVLPQTTRRAWIVTPDDRLRPEHAAIPGMNPDGVALDQPFRTPLGTFMDPPIEPNCRCGVGLIFPGFEGVL